MVWADAGPDCDDPPKDATNDQVRLGLPSTGLMVIAAFVRTPTGSFSPTADRCRPRDRARSLWVERGIRKTLRSQRSHLRGDDQRCLEPRHHPRRRQRFQPCTFSSRTISPGQSHCFTPCSVEWAPLTPLPSGVTKPLAGPG